MLPRVALLVALLLVLPLAGCAKRSECDPRHDLTDTLVESSSATEVTYRVTVDGGKSNAGQEVALFGVGPAGETKAGSRGTLDSEGRLTMRVTVPVTWDRAELETRRADSDRDDSNCGSMIVNPDIDVPSAEPGTSTPAEPTDPTPTDPTPTTPTASEPERCVTYITRIETDREHFTGESDAIYRISVAGDVPDGAKVRGRVNGAPVEGEVIRGVAELRHRVYAYGEYTLTDIEIVADTCTHDHEKDAQTSATANVS